MKQSSRNAECRAAQEGPRLCLHTPALKELWFRQRLLADPATMRYNHAWGGTIDFPEERWAAWYDHWVLHPEGKRFYRYAAELPERRFVGETAFHWDEARAIWCADVIILAEYRRRGYGRAALRLLCDAARENGVELLRDDIAIDNPAARMFLAEGFVEEYRTEEFVMLKKEL